MISSHFNSYQWNNPSCEERHIYGVQFHPEVPRFGPLPEDQFEDGRVNARYLALYRCQPKNRGKTRKWMVYNGENHSKIHDLGGFPSIFGNTHI